jgi:hypothetical protein
VELTQAADSPVAIQAELTQAADSPVVTPVELTQAADSLVATPVELTQAADSPVAIQAELTQAAIPSRADRTMELRVLMIPSHQTTPTAMMACPRPEIPVMGSPATEILMTACPTWMTTAITTHPPMVVGPTNCPAIRTAAWATTWTLRVEHPMAISSQLIPTMGCLLKEEKKTAGVVVATAPRPAQALRPHRISNSRSKNSKSQGQTPALGGQVLVPIDQALGHQPLGGW